MPMLTKDEAILLVYAISSHMSSLIKYFKIYIYMAMKAVLW